MEMKTCPKCNKELKDTAKFCGGCGYKFPDELRDAACPVCHNCGNVLKQGAKFCGKCGTKIDAKDADAIGAKGMETLGSSGFIRWTMLPGQVAVRISEAEIEACGKIRGIAIQDGLKALFFVNGKLVSELGAGSYRFDNLKADDDRAGGFWGFLSRSGDAAARVVSRIRQAISQSVTGAKDAVSVVLVRSTEFPLIFEIKGANTRNLRTDIGLHMFCRVANVNEFYRNLLVDRPFVGFDEIQKSLMPVVSDEVNLAVASLEPGQVSNNPSLVQSLANRLQVAMPGVYPFIAVGKVLQVTADNQALARLRGLGEELYVSEQELAHLQKRNDFLNRLQATKNEQELAEIKAANGKEVDKGRLEAELKARKLEIYRQMALSQDEQEKFDLMLSADKKLREAKTQDQIDAAMHDYEKSGMLREQEIDRLRHEGRMADLRNTQELDMAALRGEISMKREQDSYADERREKDAAFQDSRRRAEMQMDRDEQQNQLDMLRQAQALRMERENAEHRRAMESENAARAHEEAMQKAKLDAQIESKRIYAGMSFEQIMAANPDISPEAAKALAQKFSSDGKDELLKAREADMARQSAQQMEMMRMMQQMAMAGMGANQQHQQEMMAAKQAELNRTREDANRNEDRMLSGVQATVAAAGAAFSGKATGEASRSVRKNSEDPISAATPKAMPPTAAKCPHCGAELEAGSSFCGECGASI